MWALFLRKEKIFFMKCICSIYIFFSCLLRSLTLVGYPELLCPHTFHLITIGSSVCSGTGIQAPSPFLTQQIPADAVCGHMLCWPQSTSRDSGSLKLKTDVCIIQFQGPSSLLTIPHLLCDLDSSLPLDLFPLV